LFATNNSMWLLLSKFVLFFISKLEVEYLRYY
jgi:hypothetical protein